MAIDEQLRGDGTYDAVTGQLPKGKPMATKRTDAPGLKEAIDKTLDNAKPKTATVVHYIRKGSYNKEELADLLAAAEEAFKKTK